MKIIIFCLILLFNCFLLAGYKSNGHILDNLQMKKVTDWGYACGGKCSFNWSGKSQVDLIMEDNPDLDRKQAVLEAKRINQENTASQTASIVDNIPPFEG